ncbi:hypothetical protein SAY86_000026 [Trapa natans]|uniref:Carbohydrate kinase PfkB domain-containing protein n=1 Tax=Trapa natans TaxID=22666 RepID=A0AAN7M3D4_TRANT|nr:hypothetical protein SAY86_000026 [Trapa natans]
MEENSAQRRLQCLCRHLLQQYDAGSAVLRQVLMNGGRLDSGEGRDRDGEAVIIGGMVLDIHAVPSTPLVSGTTSPGKVYYFHGGVARNVAECMSNLSVRPFLISALGHDMAGNLLFEHWKLAGLHTEGIRRHGDIRTAVVCSTLDLNGEIATGVANVQDIETFVSAEWIQQFRYQIRSSTVLMVDANLGPSALKASCQLAAEYDIPLWFEPVSLSKSKRVVPIVKHVSDSSLKSAFTGNHDKVSNQNF